MGWCCPRQQTEPRTPTEHWFNLPPAPHTHPCVNPNSYWSKHAYNILVGLFLFPAVLIFTLFSVGWFFVLFFNRNILKWYVLLWGGMKRHQTEHLFSPVFLHSVGFPPWSTLGQGRIPDQESSYGLFNEKAGAREEEAKFKSIFRSPLMKEPHI